LAKVVTNFFKSDRYQTESEFRLSAMAPGISYTSSVQLRAITQLPNKFRIELTFAQPNPVTEPSYLMVSDGEQVWLYRPSSKEYAIMSYEEFKRWNDSFFMGLSTQAFLEVPPEFQATLAQNPVSGNTLVEMFQGLLSNDIPLAGGQRNLQGQDYYVYQYTDAGQGYTFSALVEPTTATVEQFEIAGTSEGMDVTMEEKILRRTDNPAIAADTFTFVPPQGSTKVESFSIEPY
jgi:outer membrane lipoprotein-sorting protein